MYLLLKPSLQGEEAAAVEACIDPAISAPTRLNNMVWVSTIQSVAFVHQRSAGVAAGLSLA